MQFHARFTLVLRYFRQKVRKTRVKLHFCQKKCNFCEFSCKNQEKLAFFQEKPRKTRVFLVFWPNQRGYSVEIGTNHANVCRYVQIQKTTLLRACFERELYCRCLQKTRPFEMKFCKYELPTVLRSATLVLRYFRQKVRKTRVKLHFCQKKCNFCEFLRKLGKISIFSRKTSKNARFSCFLAKLAQNYAQLTPCGLSIAPYTHDFSMPMVPTTCRSANALRAKLAPFWAI